MYVVLEGPDGSTLLRTPLLHGQLACRATILSMRMNALLEEAYERGTTAAGDAIFTLRATDGPLLATSPPYPNTEARERAIEAVRRCAPWAIVTHVSPKEGDVLERERANHDAPPASQDPDERRKRDR